MSVDPVSVKPDFTVYITKKHREGRGGGGGNLCVSSDINLRKNVINLKKCRT